MALIPVHAVRSPPRKHCDFTILFGGRAYSIR